MYEGGINVAQHRHNISAGGERESAKFFLVVHANYQVVVRYFASVRHVLTKYIYRRCVSQQPVKDVAAWQVQLTRKTTLRLYKFQLHIRYTC
jgi:hypothetical protein